MLKQYCDLCGDEIKEKTLRGGLMRQRLVFPMIPMGLKGEMRAAQQVNEEIFDLCEKCQQWIFVLYENRRKELSKS